MTLLILLGGAWLIATFWAYSLSRNLFLEREIRYGWVQVGDRLEEHFVVGNDSWLPGLWLEVEDHSDLPDYTVGRVTAVDGKAITEWRTEGVCTRRGLYTLGPTSLHSGDPLGLYDLEVCNASSTVLLVLPPVLPLPTIEISAGGRAGDGRRPRRQALETTTSAETVHEYNPGEPLKAIHWPTSARKGSLYVRQFEHMPVSDQWIFLDMQQSAQVGSGENSTEEHGVLLAASLADRGLRQGHAVGLATYGEGLTWLPPQRSPGRLMEILHALALVHAGEQSLPELLAGAQKSIRSGTSLVIITSNVGVEWLPVLLGLVRKGITPTVLLLDPRSFGGEGSPTGLIGLLDEFGIANHLIQRELLDRPEARPGSQGKWEWRTIGYGKAVAVRRPSDTGWRPLGG